MTHSKEPKKKKQKKQVGYWGKWLPFKGTVYNNTT